MRRLMVFALLLVLTTALWATGSQEVSPSERVTLKTYIGQHVAQENADYDDYYWTHLVEDTFNVDFDFTIIPGSIARERMNIAFAAGELHDLLLGTAVVGPIKFDAMRAGMLLPLEDRIRAGSGWINHPYWSTVVGGLTESDGHIYTLPRGVLRADQRNAGGRMFWNTMWLDELGLDVPTTVDEVYTVLETIKREMPDTIPVTGLYASARTHSYFMNAFGMKSDFWGVTLLDHLNVVNGEVVLTYAHPNYGAYLEFMNRLYANELLDQEYFTQTNAQMVAKASELKYFMIAGGGPHVIVGNNADSLQYAAARPVTSSLNPEPWWPERNPFAINAAAIPATSAHPDKAWEILDWTGTLQAEALEVSIILPEWYDERYLPQGLTRENILNPPINGVIQPHKTVANLDEWTFTNQYLAPRGSNIPGVVGGWDADSRWGQALGVEIFDPASPGDWFQITTKTELSPYFTYYPTERDLKFTAAEQEVLNQYVSDLESFVDEMQAKFIIGVEPLSRLSAYMTELKRYGLDEVTAVYQAAYDRWRASQQ